VGGNGSMLLSKLNIRWWRIAMMRRTTENFIFIFSHHMCADDFNKLGIRPVKKAAREERDQ
jgi:hypothetical protein